MKFLIAGLGNIGAEYVHTRHNIGFDVVDTIAREAGVSFTSGKKAWMAEVRHKGRTLVLIKPTTYMNLSGEAVRFWLGELKIPKENLLVIADDLALPYGTLRMRPAGSAAGHNGITSLIECLGNDQFARLRFGIGSDFPKGRQVDFVLGHWSSEEAKQLQERINVAGDMVKSFCSIGLQPTMNAYNNK
ncbi:aminoacyl-tRNA hydrolase [soil metagenome]